MLVASFHFPDEVRPEIEAIPSSSLNTKAPQFAIHPAVVQPVKRICSLKESCMAIKADVWIYHHFEMHKQSFLSGEYIIAHVQPQVE